MNWLDYIVIGLTIVLSASRIETAVNKCAKNQEKLIEQNEQIIELLKTNNDAKEIQFVR